MRTVPHGITIAKRFDPTSRDTAAAAAGGVFGVPSFVFDGKLFFGSDRMDLLDAALGRRSG